MGKIVICDGGTISGVQTGLVIKHFEGVGMILTNIVANEDLVMMDCQLLLTIDVEETEAKEMKRYALARRKNTAKLAFLGTRLRTKPLLVVAPFSSRGSNFLILEILKFDVVAPGANILVAWIGIL